MGFLAARGTGTEQGAARGHQSSARGPRLGRQRFWLQLHPQPPPAKERPPEEASLLKYR